MWCCRTTSYAASRRCARRSTSTECGPTWWWPAPPPPTRPGAARPASRSRTSGLPPSWRCRTGAAGIPSTIPASIATAGSTRWQQAGPTRSPIPTRRVAVSPLQWTEKTLRHNRTHFSRHRPQPPKPSAPPSKTFRTRALTVPGVGEGAPGRRSRARNVSGRVVTATDGSDAGPGATDCTCSPPCCRRPSVPGPGRCGPRPDDLRRAIREGREGNLVIFVVDASGSMAASRSHGRRQRRHPVAAARRLPTARQGRGDHVPPARGSAAAPAHVVGAHRRPAAGPIRHGRQDAARRGPAGRA